MVFQEYRNAMPAHGLFRQGTAALGYQMTVLQPDGLLIEARIADDRRRDLRFIRLDDAYAVFRQVLIS
jgi:hypothetical protein